MQMLMTMFAVFHPNGNIMQSTLAKGRDAAIAHFCEKSKWFAHRKSGFMVKPVKVTMSWDT